ncbi:N-acetyltransferase [Halobacillus fulvus]|nr:N-acetyltransferase [Halobacillus fulvus]
MSIQLEKLQLADLHPLYEFERENRHFFEKMVPSRGDDYYRLDTFEKNHKALLDEQTRGEAFYSLIKDEHGHILGRMNLTDIDLTERSGSIGYRIGEEHTGKGIAYQALELFLEDLSHNGIRRVFAKTTTNHIASQKVLEKNGFEYRWTDDEVFEMNGQLLKFVYYEKIL